MRRAHAVRPAGQWDDVAAIDAVVLDASARHRRRLVLTAERGTRVLLDLPHAVALKDGDGLVLDDGALVRLAWHLGNRHAEVQVVGDRLRIRRDHVLAALLERLGARLTAVEAPFDPE